MAGRSGDYTNAGFDNDLVQNDSVLQDQPGYPIYANLKLVKTVTQSYQFIWTGGTYSSQANITIQIKHNLGFVPVVMPWLRKSKAGGTKTILPYWVANTADSGTMTISTLARVDSVTKNDLSIKINMIGSTYLSVASAGEMWEFGADLYKETYDL